MPLTRVNELSVDLGRHSSVESAESPWNPSPMPGPSSGGKMPKMAERRSSRAQVNDHVAVVSRAHAAAYFHLLDELQCASDGTSPTSRLLDTSNLLVDRLRARSVPSECDADLDAAGLPRARRGWPRMAGLVPLAPYGWPRMGWPRMGWPRMAERVPAWRRPVGVAVFVLHLAYLLIRPGLSAGACSGAGLEGGTSARRPRRRAPLIRRAARAVAPWSARLLRVLAAGARERGRPDV